MARLESFLIRPAVNQTRSIVVPCHNEAESIGGVLSDIRGTFGDDDLPEVVVLDDGSTDGTREEAERSRFPSLRVVRNERARGYGEAIKTGIRAARGEMICLMDGDGQHTAGDAKRLFAASAQRSLVVGRRDDPGRGARRLARSLLRRWSRAVGGIEIHDSNSGLMVFERAIALRMLPFLPDSMSYSDSFKLLFHLLHMDVVEVPITVKERTAGRSKNSVSDGFKTLASAFTMVVLVNPLRIFVPAGLGALIFGVAWGIPFLVMGRGLTAVAVASILTGLLFLFFGLVFRILAGISQSIILGNER